MTLINEDNLNISAEQIAQEGLNALDSKYQKSVGFFAWDYFVSIGKIVYKVWDKVIYIAKCLIDLSNMNYDDLVKFIWNTRGIEAKSETASSGLLKLTYGNGTIREGDIFETSSGVQFRATETSVVSENGYFKVECMTKGIVGNVPANSIVVIPTTIQGIVKVTNEEAFNNGYDKETKEALLERYYIDLRTPATSGNVYHYQKWALEVTGVGKVKVKPLWNGNNTVKVVILNSNNEIANQELIKKVQDYIDPYVIDDEGNKNGWGCGNGTAPIGAYCTVTTAESLKLNIKFSAKINSKYEGNTIYSNVENAIKTFLDEVKFCELEPTETSYFISFSKLASKVALAEGIEDLDIDTFKVNDSQENIIILDNNNKTQIAEIGTIQITELNE